MMNTTMRTALLFALVSVLLVMLASPAAAQRRDPNRAGELAGEAREAFSTGNYTQAAELLSQAYSLYPEPNFIYNTARAWELAGNFARAEASYLRYLDQDIGDEDRTKSQERLARITALRDLPAKLQDAQDFAALDALSFANTKMKNQIAAGITEGDGNATLSPTSILAWTCAGLGVVALGATATLQLASVGTVEEYHDTANEGTDRAKYDALKDTLDTRVAVSQVLLISGILLSATGGTLLYFEYFDNPDTESPQPSPPSATFGVAPLVTHDTAGISLGGSF